MKNNSIAKIFAIFCSKMISKSKSRKFAVIFALAYWPIEEAFWLANAMIWRRGLIAMLKLILIYKIILKFNLKVDKKSKTSLKTVNIICY